MKTLSTLLPIAASALATFACIGCGSDDPQDAAVVSTAPCAEPAFTGSPLGVRCNQLVDTQGRVVFLRGINARVEGVFDVTFDDGRVALEEIPPFTQDDAEQMRQFGFDALRLPINWSAIEPTEQGGFDEAYLDRVEQAVDLASAAGMQVLVDLHQDAWSKEIGEDGAPLWAIYPPPTADQLLEGPLTDLDARRQSDVVLAAFNTFFGDSPDGERLRGRFVAMARHVAARFADHPGVLGLEIFNEPVSDSTGLMRLYVPAIEALREVAPNKLFVFEPSTMRNFTDSAPIASAPLGDGSVYAPHVYTLAFVGSDEQRQNMTKDTLRRSHTNAVDEAASWSAPLMITEWGYAPDGIKATEYYTWQSELQEESQASSFFWVWKEMSQGSWGCFDRDASAGAWTIRPAVRKALARVRPAAVAGWPTQFAFDRASGVFELTFRSDPTVRAPHAIAIAPVLGQPATVSCDGVDVPGATADGNGMLDVACGTGDSAEHVLRVTVAPMP